LEQGAQGEADDCYRGKETEFVGVDEKKGEQYSLTYSITLCSRVSLEKSTGFEVNQEIPRILWNNPDSSSPYSQAPATCPYPEPNPSSPHNPFPLPQDPS
jgi:hypothetical protein